MALDDTHVYYTFVKQVVRIRKDGTDPTNLLPQQAEFEGLVNDIRVDGDHVFAAHSSGIARVPAVGGSVQEIVGGRPDHFTSESLVLDSTHVYFFGGMTDPDDPLAVVPYIGRVPRDGGTMQQLSAHAPSHIALHGDSLAFNTFEYPQGAAPILQVRSVPRTGGAETVLLDDTRWYHPLTTQTHLIYATVEGIYRLALGGSTPERIVEGTTFAGRMALSPDGETLYFTGDGTSIYYVPADAIDATPKRLIGGTASVLDLEVDDEFVYYLDAYPQAGLYRVPR